MSSSRLSGLTRFLRCFKVQKIVCNPSSLHHLFPHSSPHAPQLCESECCLGPSRGLVFAGCTTPTIYTPSNTESRSNQRRNLFFTPDLPPLLPNSVSLASVGLPRQYRPCERSCWAALERCSLAHTRNLSVGACLWHGRRQQLECRLCNLRAAQVLQLRACCPR